MATEKMTNTINGSMVIQFTRNCFQYSCLHVLELTRMNFSLITRTRLYRSMIAAARGIVRIGRSWVTASIYSSVRQREVTARVGET